MKFLGVLGVEMGASGSAGGGHIPNQNKKRLWMFGVIRGKGPEERH